MSTTPAGPPSGPQDVEADLARRRAALLADAQALGEFIAPAHVKAMASEAVSSRVTRIRTRVTEALSPQRLKARATRLVDDARDGEPASLSLLTGLAASLAILSTVALVKALRR